MVMPPLKPPPIPNTHAPQGTLKVPEEPQTPEPQDTPPLPPIGPQTVIQCQNSSMVHSFEYDKRERIMRVYFRGGQIYDYFFVPEEVAEEFKTVCENPSESAGKWFARNVRKAYEYQKIS